jgi:uncharacterized YccA/Bax inhibitor family protein
MSIIKGNPMLTEERFASDVVYEEAMSVKGTAQKTGILFAILMFTGSISWSMMTSNPGLSGALTLLGAIGGLIALLVGMFRPATGRIAAPLYAAFEGLFLGAISFMFEGMYTGIVMQAVLLTLGVLLVMIGLYSGRIIRASNTFIKVITVSTIAVCGFYIFSWVAALLGFNTLMEFHQGNSLLSIGFSLFVVVLAALNFVVDFDMIERGEEMGAPGHMEWFGAMSVMVTLIWLYVNILRLLSKLSSRD